MKTNYEPKPLFIERMKLLLKDNRDLEEFFKTNNCPPKRSIRVNTLKTTPKELRLKLEKYNWKFNEINNHPEILQIVSNLDPGELGKSKEHILGYFYVQEITSMMPVLALNPRPGEIILDLCAAPGSKTTQIAAMLNNSGTIIANDLNIGRIQILSSNLERLGVTNTIVSRHDGNELSKKLKKINFYFDKILVDAPCSGEGNIRCSKRTYMDWSIPLLERLGNNQKRLAKNALELLKVNGEMVYSTCTHAPEENEEVIQYLLDNYNIEILEINLPINTREGITSWKDKIFSKELKKAIRIYPQDNDMEGFFLCKIRKLGENKK